MMINVGSLVLLNGTGESVANGVGWPDEFITRAPLLVIRLDDLTIPRMLEVMAPNMSTLEVYDDWIISA